MNQPATHLTNRTAASANVGDAVWDFMTTIKSVRKRDGRQENFDIQKLNRSIVEAMWSAGVKDENRAQKITTQINSRLRKIYDGHTEPSTGDVREIVSLTFIDNNLVHVAKKYVSF